MATDLLGLLLHVNVAAGIAVLAVLAVRRRGLKAFGPELAYRLWACVPAPAFAALLPDAAVLATLPGQRRRYAETLLKTQLGARTVPLGCHWLAGSAHPLEQRISALARPRLDERRYDWGLGLVTAAVVLSVLAVWKMQP